MAINVDVSKLDELILRVLMASDRLLEDTLSGAALRVAEALDRAHMEVASVLTYNDENSLACAIGLAYYSARKDYRLVRNFPLGAVLRTLCFCRYPIRGSRRLW